MASDYAHRHTSIDGAIDSLIAWQVGKAGVAGFATGLGGLITLAAAVPANLTSVAFVQLRMVACTYLRGYDPRSDQVKAMAFACLCGAQLANVLKEAGIQITEKISFNIIMKQLTRGLITNINRAVGFRLVTKVGTTGIINVVRIIPVIGGVVNGTFDGVLTHSIAYAAKSVFQGSAPETSGL